MKKTLLIALLVVASGAAFAQQKKGDFQLQAQGAYYSTDAFDFGSLYFNASKFVTDNIEIGVSPYLTISTETTMNLTFFSNYSFLTTDAKLVPYLGAGITFYNLGSDFGSLTGFTLKGGIRYFVNERVNIDVGPNLVLLEGSNLFVLNAGLGYIFGSR